MAIERRVILVHSLDLQNVRDLRKLLVQISLSKMTRSTAGDLVLREWDPLVLEALTVGLELLEVRMGKAFGEGQK